MVAGDVATVILAPGRLVVNPSDLSTTYPYGGTEVGKTMQCRVQPLGRSFQVEYESLGETGAVLNPDRRYLFTCILRGWDNDAIRLLLTHSDASAGAVSQHRQYAPQNVPGVDTDTQDRILLYVPDDLVHVPAVLIYAGVPDWSEGAEVAFDRQEEITIPLTVVALRDSNDNQIAIARFEDLSLT